MGVKHEYQYPLKGKAADEANEDNEEHKAKKKLSRRKATMVSSQMVVPGFILMLTKSVEPCPQASQGPRI
jgi:hypothetical protein